MIWPRGIRFPFSVVCGRLNKLLAQARQRLERLQASQPGRLDVQQAQAAVESLRPPYTTGKRSAVTGELTLATCHRSSIPGVSRLIPSDVTSSGGPVTEYELQAPKRCLSPMDYR